MFHYHFDIMAVAIDDRSMEEPSRGWSARSPNSGASGETPEAKRRWVALAARLWPPRRPRRPYSPDAGSRS